MKQVLPTLDQMTDILDIKPIIQVSLLWFWILLLLLLLALGFWAYYYFKHRGAPPKKMKPEPLLSPREVALRDLEELDLSGILERAQYRKYYFRLSEIVRLFLQDEIKVPAVDTTTEEIHPHLMNSVLLKPEEKELIAQILIDMDLVKFARYVPTGEQVKQLRDQIRHFIQSAHLPVPSPEDETKKREGVEGGVDVSS